MLDERKGESGRMRDRGGGKDVTPACSLQMWRRVLYCTVLYCAMLYYIIFNCMHFTIL